MRLRQTKSTVDAYADALKAADAPSASAGMQAIALLLDEFADEQMSTLVRRGSLAVVGVSAQNRASENSVCAGAAGQLDLLAKIVASAGAKRESIKDLKSLSTLLRGLGESESLSAGLAKLRDAMRPVPIEEQIDRFIDRLKKQQGTASFDHIFEELAASRLKREHVVAVAMSVYGGIKKSTSRKAALDYIRKPHDAYVSAKRGIDATGGRSAA